MAEIRVEELPELPGPGRLGRHREHDDRSRAYAVAEGGVPIRSVRWERRAPIFDQGQIGSCTGNAMAGALGTDSAARTGSPDMTEQNALMLYESATRRDRIPGVYPPDDTGSSGIAVAKAARSAGLITAYRHAFSLRSALAALQHGPVITGIAWLTGCDEPDRHGLVQYRGEVRGGHEILLREYDADRQLLTFDNSWSTSWGLAGSFLMSVDDFGRALRNGGDVTVPIYS